MGKIVKFKHKVNNVVIEQRVNDGFINATTMCVAHGKDVSDWLKTDDIWELVVALASDLGIKAKNRKSGNSAYTRVSAAYPTLVIVKRGAPDNGGGTWVHPDLAIQLAQWCNKPFALLVSRWVREWFATGKNPIAVDSDVEKDYVLWEQRHDLRVLLKDFFRPELMDATVAWCKDNGVGAYPVCRDVHDAINERVQGKKSKEIKALGNLPLGVLLRDHFDARYLVVYIGINQSAVNAIRDRNMHPVDAINYACDNFLGKSYTPQLVSLQENVYKEGKRLSAARKQKSTSKATQLSLFDKNDIA